MKKQTSVVDRISAGADNLNMADLCYDHPGVEEVKEGLHQGSLHLRQDKHHRHTRGQPLPLRLKYMLKIGHPTPNGSHLEELFEEGTGDGQHELVGRQLTVLALDRQVNVLLQGGRGTSFGCLENLWVVF